MLTPPSETLTASASSVVMGGSVTLTWTSSYATSCSLQGGSLDTTVPPTGTQQGIDVAPGGSRSVMVPKTATYMLTCSGQNDLMVNESVTVTATSAPAKSSGGGGSIDPWWLYLSAGLCVARRIRR